VIIRFKLKMHKNDNCVRASVCVYKRVKIEEEIINSWKKNWQNVEKGYEGMG